MPSFNDLTAVEQPDTDQGVDDPAMAKVTGSRKGKPKPGGITGRKVMSGKGVPRLGKASMRGKKSGSRKISTSVKGRIR